MTTRPDEISPMEALNKIEKGLTRISGEEWYNVSHGKNYIETIRAALTAQASVPEGWKLVPIEPTNNMIANAYNRRMNRHVKYGEMYADIYTSMLNAAPQPPAGEME